MKINRLLKYILVGLILGGLAVIFMSAFSIPVTGYMLASILYAGVVVSVEAGHRSAYIKKRKEYEEIDAFLSEVRHSFHAHGMADEAVCDAVEIQSSPYMRREGLEILEVLNSEDADSAAAEYRSGKKNRYLNLFLTLCLTVIEFGDKKTENGSLFLNNIMNLKEELRAEIEAEALLKAKMTGVGLIAAAPAFCLKIIEKWGVSNLPELAEFYSSRGGITLMTGLFFSSCAVYAVLCILRGISEAAEPVYSILQKISLNSVVFAFLSRLSHIFKNSSRNLKRLINEAGSLLSPEEIYLAKILLAGVSLLALNSSVIISNISKKNSISPWFILILSGAVFFIPELLLLVKRYMNRIRMDEEVAQYNSVITMLMHVERISVYELMEELEQFAVIFKRSLSDCLNDFHSGEEKALEEMRDREGCTAFRSLADKLMMCDKIGVRAAFDEVNADRSFYMKRRSREQEQNIQKRSVLGQFIAFIPLVAAVGLYLIVPFAKESIVMLGEITAEINL